MVEQSVDLLGLLRKRAADADLDFLGEAVTVLAEALMEAEVSAQIGAGYGERTATRTTQRNGYRPRRWDTRVGTVGLQIPKLRAGSYFPALLEPRRRSERALLAVVQQAYVEGVSTRRVDSEASETVRAALGDGAALGQEIGYAREETPLGPGGAIAAAATAASLDETFLVCNGDIIIDLDISAMLKARRARRDELTISLREVDDSSSFGVVTVGPDGRTERFVEKPAPGAARPRLINAGTWFIEPPRLARMDAARFNRVEEGMFPALASAGRAIFGFHERCYRRDVGDPEAYLAVNLDLLRGAIRDVPSPGATVRASSFGRRDGRGQGPPRGAVLGQGARIGEGEQLAPGTRIVGRRGPRGGCRRLVTEIRFGTDDWRGVIAGTTSPTPCARSARRRQGTYYITAWRRRAQSPTTAYAPTPMLSHAGCRGGADSVLLNPDGPAEVVWQHMPE